MRFYEFLDFQFPSKKVFIIFFSVFVVLLSLSFLIHVRVKQSLVGYTIAESEIELQELEAHLKQLKLERAVLKRPERIQRKASEWSKMRNSYD